MSDVKRRWRKARAENGPDVLVGDTTTASGPGSRFRFGLLAKITVFLAVVLVPLAVVSWMVAYRSLQDSLTREFTEKGSAIATSLASSATDLIANRDALTMQTRADEFARITGVAYVIVYDPQGTFVAHTFGPVVPKGLVEKNVVPGHATRPQVQQVAYADPRTGGERDVVDIGMPVRGGKLGTVRVGMDKAVVSATALQAGNFLLLVFGGIAAAALLAGVIFAQRITRPVNALINRRRTEPEVDSPTRACPHCYSSIPVQATRCAFCTSEIGAATAWRSSRRPRSTHSRSAR